MTIMPRLPMTLILLAAALLASGTAMASFAVGFVKIGNQFGEEVGRPTTESGPREERVGVAERERVSVTLQIVAREGGGDGGATAVADEEKRSQTHGWVGQWLLHEFAPEENFVQGTDESRNHPIRGPDTK